MKRGKRAFTIQGAEKIRRLVASGKKARTLAKNYGVHETTISHIVHDRTYAGWR